MVVVVMVMVMMNVDDFCPQQTTTQTKREGVGTTNHGLQTSQCEERHGGSELLSDHAQLALSERTSKRTLKPSRSSPQELRDLNVLLSKDYFQHGNLELGHLEVMISWAQVFIQHHWSNNHGGSRELGHVKHPL